MMYIGLWIAVVVGFGLLLAAGLYILHLRKVEWTDEFGHDNALSNDEAAKVLQELYDRWPAGLEEMEASLKVWRTSAIKLAHFAHEIQMGAYRFEEQPDVASKCLKEAHLENFTFLVQLTDDLRKQGKL